MFVSTYVPACGKFKHPKGWVPQGTYVLCTVSLAGEPQLTIYAPYWSPGQPGSVRYRALGSRDLRQFSKTADPRFCSAGDPVFNRVRYSLALYMVRRANQLRVAGTTPQRLYRPRRVVAFRHRMDIPFSDTELRQRLERSGGSEVGPIAPQTAGNATPYWLCSAQLLGSTQRSVGAYESLATWSWQYAEPLSQQRITGSFDCERALQRRRIQYEDVVQSLEASGLSGESPLWHRAVAEVSAQLGAMAPLLDVSEVLAAKRVSQLELLQRSAARLQELSKTTIPQTTLRGYIRSWLARAAAATEAYMRLANPDDWFRAWQGRTVRLGVTKFLMHEGLPAWVDS